MRFRALGTALIGAVASGAVVAGTLLAGPAAADVAPKLLVTGWFGYWASDAQVREMAEKSAGVVDEVSMFWWAFNGADEPLCTYDKADLDRDGLTGECQASSSTPWTNSGFARQRDILQEAGIRIQASITDLSSFRAGQLSTYLGSEKRRAAYARQIANWATKAGVDGVDLDMENFAFNDDRDTWPVTQKRWVAFIDVLGSTLREAGLTLSATVPGGWATSSPSTGYWVYAWDQIIDDIDRLIIMAYDYSWNSPGAIGPNDWAAKVVERAITDVGANNADKIWIGTPQYGRNWIRTSNGSALTAGSCPASWTPDSSLTRITVTPASALDLAAREGVTPTWNPTQGEWSFRYNRVTSGSANGKSRECTAKREVWFADTRSALTRASLVPDYGIGGIAVWNFGNVLPDFYPRLAEYGRKIAPAPVTVSVSAPKRVTYAGNARINVTVTSAKGAPANAKATLLWAAGTDKDQNANQADATPVATTSLDSSGKATFRTPVTESGRFWVTVAATTQTGAGESSATVTKAAWRVSKDDKSLSTTVREPVAVSAQVSPGVAGVSVRVQRKSNDGWKTVKKLNTDADGTVSTQVSATKPKQLRVRFVAVSSQGYVGGRTGAITIEVVK